jgi:hypothetical protein
VIASLDLQAFGGETGGTMAGRRNKRSDGRYCINITVENPDGTRRRLYFYGRTQAVVAREDLLQGFGGGAWCNRVGTNHSVRVTVANNLLMSVAA